MLSKKGNEKLDRILVIQLWGIGESVLTLPTVYELLKKFPDSKIDILLTDRNKDVYYGINGLRKVNLKLNPLSILKFVINNYRKYDVVIDMEEYLNISAIISFFAGNFRVGYDHGSRSKIFNKKIKYDDDQHLAQTYFDLISLIGIRGEVSGLEKLNYSKEDRNRVDNIIKDNGKLIGIAPGAAESARSRMWPKERFSKLCNLLIKEDNKIIFVGTEDERELIDNIIEGIDDKDKVVNLAGKLSLLELFYFVEKCKLFISNDAGAMHVASAQGVKTIGLFGPNLPVRFGPFGSENVAIYKGDNCKYSPCINVHKGEVPDCYYSGERYQKCMKNIEVEDVLREV
tara:strand:- start:787 stop:1815 length:1029 start_codon:yes stop_codon:yes gene_type:complete